MRDFGPCKSAMFATSGGGCAGVTDKQGRIKISIASEFPMDFSLVGREEIGWRIGILQSGMVDGKFRIDLENRKIDERGKVVETAGRAVPTK